MAASNIYFIFRHPFNFNPHKYDIGHLFFQNRKLEDNFFLLKIYEIDGEEFDAFYKYHLTFFSKINTEAEERFFKHVHDIVINRIRHFKRQNPFSNKYARGLDYARKLEAFLEFLKTIDRWHKTEPIDSVISEKDKMIDELNSRIKDLEGQLKEITKYDAGEKIVISKGGLAVFIDLVNQIRALTLPNNNKLVSSQTQSPWYKMIAKNFVHGDKPISIDTAHNYFPAGPTGASSKYIIINESDKLFKIVPNTKV